MAYYHCSTTAILNKPQYMTLLILTTITTTTTTTTTATAIAYRWAGHWERSYMKSTNIPMSCAVPWIPTLPLLPLWQAILSWVLHSQLLQVSNSRQSLSLSIEVIYVLLLHMYWRL